MKNDPIIRECLQRLEAKNIRDLLQYDKERTAFAEWAKNPNRGKLRVIFEKPPKFSND